MRSGIANLPLHPGKAPRWLFSRMVPLARQISLYMVEEQGPQEFLSKLSDPFWFQAFGCVLGFDWHSSGLTTTTGGALKEGLKDLGKDTGVFVAGGKGAVSRKTPSEIERASQSFSFDSAPLVYASKMAAKVDSAALQDGYQLYHHNFIFTKTGEWVVIQQGMNGITQLARRYHWISSRVKSFVLEPQSAICCQAKGKTLNLVAKESQKNQKVSVGLINQDKPGELIQRFSKINTLNLPVHHPVYGEDFDRTRLKKILEFAHSSKPSDFESLLSLKGMGPKSLRALALMAELIYGEKPSFVDPARFSFTHGGKDGYPFPVERDTYNLSIEILKRAVRRAKLGFYEEKRTIRRLYDFLNPSGYSANQS